jgi:hypothetical protein
MKIDSKVLGLAAFAVGAVFLFAVAERRPGYFADVTILGGTLMIEIIVVAIWHYERWFFPILMFSFLWAGSSLPLATAGNAARWIFLALGTKRPPPTLHRDSSRRLVVRSGGGGFRLGFPPRRNVTSEDDEPLGPFLI